MYRLIGCVCWLAMMSPAIGLARAETLKVGPGEKYSKPSEAFAAATEGDVIEINSAGDYAGDVATVRTGKLTIRGVGNGRVKLPANGRHAAGKAIWVTAGDGITVENIEFSGCRVPDRNGAGIRVEGANLTVRNCRFYDCENGMLGGAKGTLLIEHCEFDHCGPVADPATHSCYVSGDRLIFRYNYSTFTREGHLLKTRARESWILYNRLTDENGTGSAVVDIPDGGLAVLVGNILHKGPRAQNTRVVAYGMEGIKHQRNALYVVNNTMVYENHRANSWFVRVENAPQGFVSVIRNNLCVGPIPLTNDPKAQTDGNLLLKSAQEAGFVNPAQYDYQLEPGSPGIDKGVEPGKAGDFSLRPEFEYAHPCKSRKRPDDGKIDVGAFEFTPIRSALPGRPVKVAAICIGFGGEHDAKLKLALEHLETAGRESVDIACLPEEFAGTTAEPISGPTVEAVAKLAAKHKMYVICPIREQAGAEQYNTAVLLDRNGRTAGYYRKVFVFWGEGLHPSQEGVKAFDTDFGRISILTCFDVNFPELWQQADDLGAEIVFWPSAYGGGAPLNGHAMLHAYYIVPVGWGNLIDCTGKTIEKTACPRPHQFLATLDLDRTLVHKDFHAEKVARLLKEHAGEVELEGDFEMEGWYLLRAVKPGIQVRALCQQYQIEPLRDYRRRSRAQINETRKQGGRI